jgi:hypothetical protein
MPWKGADLKPGFDDNIYLHAGVLNTWILKTIDLIKTMFEQLNWILMIFLAGLIDGDGHISKNV